MSKITLSGHIEVPAQDLQAVCLALPKHITLTRQEAGCMVFTVTQDTNNPHRFDVYEAFTDKAAFEQHQARVKASDWGEITKNVARFYKITEDEHLV